MSEFLLQLLKRKVDHVMVVQLFWRHIVAKLQPDAVKKVDFFRRQVRRVSASQNLTSFGRAVPQAAISTCAPPAIRLAMRRGPKKGARSEDCQRLSIQSLAVR